jgi:hypothetical protein
MVEDENQRSSARWIIWRREDVAAHLNEDPSDSYCASLRFDSCGSTAARMYVVSVNERHYSRHLDRTVAFDICYFLFQPETFLANGHTMSIGGWELGGLRPGEVSHALTACPLPGCNESSFAPEPYYGHFQLARVPTAHLRSHRGAIVWHADSTNHLIHLQRA